MESSSVSERLNRLLTEGNLTLADLARWFDRPYPTVRGWLQGGDVGGAPLDTAWVLAQLKCLEKKMGKGLPVPRLSMAERAAYMEKLRKE
jgi:hypothetical protein